MTRFSTALILHGAPGSRQVRDLSDAGFGDLPLAARRPRLWLGWREGPILAVDDHQALLAVLKSHPALLGVPLLPRLELSRLDGCEFRCGFYRCRLQVGIPAGEGMEPYSRRIVSLHLEGIDASPVEGLTGQIVEVAEAPVDLTPFPIVLQRTVEADQLPGLLNLATTWAAGAEGIAWLPPVPENCESSYFSDELRAVRLGIARFLGLSGGASTPDAPTALVLWSLADEGILRPVLHTGGGLDLAGSDEIPSRVSLLVFAPKEVQTCAYGAWLLRAVEEPGGLSLCDRLAAVFLDDVKGLTPNGVAVLRADRPVRWGFAPTHPSWSTGRPRLGAHQRLARLAGQISAGLRDTFYRYIMGTTDGASEPPDHAAEEDRFFSLIASCPFDAGADPDDPSDLWRDAVRPLLLPPLEGPALPKFAPPAVRAEGGNQFTVQADLSTRERRVLLLQLPLGATVSPGGPARVGVTRLDGRSFLGENDMKLSAFPPGLQKNLRLDVPTMQAQERYLLSPTWAEAGKPVGLAQFHPERSITIQRTGTSAELAVSGVCGWTCGGRWVDVSTAEPLRTELPDGPVRMEIDAAIELDPEEAEASAEGTPKYCLRVSPSTTGKRAFPEAPGWLDLGRLVVTGSGALSWTRLPPVAKLGAMPFQETRGAEWVRPLTDVLQRLVDVSVHRSRVAGVDDELKIQSLVVAAEWPDLYVPILARRLIRLARLLRQNEELVARWPVSDGLDDFRLPPDPFDWPKALAQILEEVPRNLPVAGRALRDGRPDATGRTTPIEVRFTWEPRRLALEVLLELEPDGWLELHLPASAHPPASLVYEVGRGEQGEAQGTASTGFTSYRLPRVPRNRRLFVWPLERCEAEVWVLRVYTSESGGHHDH